jgi:hypothetical protein
VFLKRNLTDPGLIVSPNFFCGIDITEASLNIVLSIACGSA